MEAACFIIGFCCKLTVKMMQNADTAEPLLKAHTKKKKIKQSAFKRGVVLDVWLIYLPGNM